MKLYTRDIDELRQFWRECLALLRGVTLVSALCGYGLMARSAAAVTIQAAAGSLSVDMTTSSTTYVQTDLQVSLTGLTAGTDVVVIANFSSKSADGPLIGSWVVTMDNETLNSYPMERYIPAAPNNEGMVSLVYVFENVAAGNHQFEVLQKVNDITKSLTTYNGNLAAIPLVTTGDILPSTLNYGISPLVPRDDTLSPTLEPVLGVEAQVILPAMGDVFVVASFAAESEQANSQGTWRLSLDNGTKQYLSNAVVRKVQYATPSPLVDPADARDVNLTLVGVGQNLPAGTYAARLEHQTDTSGTKIWTTNATVVGVALALNDGRRFQAFQQLGGAMNTQCNYFGTGLTDTFALLEMSDVLVASHFGVSSNGGQPGMFRVGVDAAFSRQGELVVLSASDIKSGGNIALLPDVAQGAGHASKLQFSKPPGTPPVGTEDCSGQQLEVNFPVLVTILLNTNASVVGGGVIDLYRATLSTLDQKTAIDTCRARDMGEARAAFEARHPGAQITHILYIPDALARGYRLFLGGVRTADRRNVRDTCFAQNPSQARDILGERYPGGVVNHMGLFPHNRQPVTYYGVTQRPDLFHRLLAANPREAFAAFNQRFLRDRVVAVTRVGNETGLRTYEGMVEPEETTTAVKARSVDSAASAALALNPHHTLVRVQSGRVTDGILTYDGQIRTAAGRELRDTCSARSMPEAEKTFKHRYGEEGSSSVQEMDMRRGYDLFVGEVSAEGEQNLEDATYAENPDKASEIIQARYPQRTVSGVTAVTDQSAFREFQGAVNTQDGRNVLDTCWASGASAARKVFLARFPGGEIRRLSPYSQRRPDEYDVTLKGLPTRECCQARDKAEAYRILATRFPKARVMSVQEAAEAGATMAFRATLNTPDHQTITETIEAKSSSDARQLLLERHPGSRFSSLQQATGGPVDETYEARIDLSPAKDTCQASSPAEARGIFLARYPRGSTGALRHILTGP